MARFNEEALRDIAEQLRREDPHLTHALSDDRPARPRRGYRR
jgi:hypothetical protein